MQAEQTKNTIKLLEKFQEYQTERTHTYKLFESSFKDFLANTTDKASIINYQRVCQGVTLTFKDISDGIKEVEKSLLESDHTKEYAAQLRKVQNFEKDKLQNTVTLQKLEQQIAQEQLRLRKETESEELLRNHVHDANDHDHEQGGHCCHHHDEEVIRGERLFVLEEELKKYKHEQAEIIDNINDVLEELRYAKEDLRELYQEQKNNPQAEVILPVQKEEPKSDQGIYL